MRLNNKVAIVTGAGRGIGRATALLFAKEGAKVVLNDLRAELVQETAKLITEQGGGSANTPACSRHDGDLIVQSHLTSPC